MLSYFRAFLRPAATLTVPGVNFGGDGGSCGLARRRCVKGDQEQYSQEQRANRSVQGVSQLVISPAACGGAVPDGSA